MQERRRVLLALGGWTAFVLGWIGIFLPGLPTTIFWILAALAFLRTNQRMYEKICAHRRFGPGVRLFVEEGKISRRGKWISIAAMLGFSSLGALAIPPAWAKILVLAAAGLGTVWVAILPTPEDAEDRAQASRQEPREPIL